MSYSYHIAGAPYIPGYFQIPTVYNQAKVYLNGALVADSGDTHFAGVVGQSGGTGVTILANVGDRLRIQGIQCYPYDSGNAQSGSYLSELNLTVTGSTYRYQHLSAGFPLRQDLPVGTFFDQEFVITLRPDVDPLEDERNKCDPCAWLRYLLSVAQLSAGSANLSYTAANAGRAPASLGWGWTMVGANKQVVTDGSNSDKVFYNGTGSFERWKVDGAGGFIPRFSDNYDSLVVNGSGQVVITTKEKVVMTFRASDGKISTEVDRNGNTVTYSYDSLGRLTSKSDGEGRVLYVGYATASDPNDLQPAFLREQSLTTGRLTSFTYDANGRLWKVTDPEGEVTELLYNAAGLLWKKIDPRGKTEVEYTYSSGKVATEKRYGEVLLTYSSGVDAEGNPTTTIQEEDLTPNSDATVRTTVLTFDSYARVIKKVDPMGNVWVSRYLDPLNPYLRLSIT